MEYPNWFDNNIKDFKKYLNQYKHVSNLKFLQIGAYTGDASKWILENILTNKTSILIDVDTWRGSEEEIHKTFNWNEIHSLYNSRMSNFSNSIKYVGTSTSYLQSCNVEFDFIYIDGDHTAGAVYQDATLSFPFLKNNGIMAFDDYLWNHKTKLPELEPKMGVDRFLTEHEKDVEILSHGYQVWIKKLKK